MLSEEIELKLNSTEYRSTVLLLGDKGAGKSSLIRSVISSSDPMATASFTGSTRGYCFANTLVDDLQPRLRLVELGSSLGATLGTTHPLRMHVDAVGLCFDGRSAHNFYAMWKQWWQVAASAMKINEPPEAAKDSTPGNNPFFFVVETHVKQATLFYRQVLRLMFPKDTQFLYFALDANNKQQGAALWNVVCIQADLQRGRVNETRKRK